MLSGKSLEKNLICKKRDIGENSPKIVTFSKNEPKIIHFEYFKILLKLIFTGNVAQLEVSLKKKKIIKTDNVQ